MRKTLAAAVSALLILSMAVTAFGEKVNIKIDGIAGNSEWKNATVIGNVSGNVNNRFRSWGAECLFDSDGNTVYYLLTASLDSPAGSSGDEDSGPEKMGVKFTLTGCSEVEMTFSGVSDTYTVSTTAGDNETYRIDAAMHLYEDSGTLFVEIKVTYYDGAPATAGGTVKFYDDLGEPTTAKSFTAENPDYTVTEADEDGTATSKSSKSSSSKTTTAKSSATHKIVVSTSRVQTTSYGVRKITAAAAETTATEKTTKEKTTKEKTTAKTTTAKAKTTKASSAKTTAAVNEETGENVIVITVYDTTGAATDVSGETGNGSAFALGNISRSAVYKAVTGVCALILFGVIGVWAVRSKNSSPDDEENDSGQDDDKS